MSIDQSAAALSAALRAFGVSLGRSLSEGITQGLQEGLSQSLDLNQLVEQVPARAPAPAPTAHQRPAPRRGGRPRGEVRPCRVPGCEDPARSRGLCSRHYQQELRREKAEAEGETPDAEPLPAVAMPVEARPPIVRKPRVDEPAAEPVMPYSGGSIFYQPQPEPVLTAPQQPEPRREEIRSPTEAAKRIFG